MDHAVDIALWIMVDYNFVSEFWSKFDSNSHTELVALSSYIEKLFSECSCLLGSNEYSYRNLCALV